MIHIFFVSSNTSFLIIKCPSSRGQIKYSPDSLVRIDRATDGKIIFLEQGNSKAGLQHIIEEHASDFKNIGVTESEIPDVVMNAVLNGVQVGYQGRDKGRPIYEIMLHGEKRRIAVTVGDNGFIVGANPVNRKQKMKKIKLMADYDCYPLWHISKDEFGDIDPASLPISEKLVNLLEKWAKEYDLTLNRSDPASSGFPSSEAEDSFKKQGKYLLNCLMSELNGKYEVVYQEI